MRLVDKESGLPDLVLDLVKWLFLEGWLLVMGGVPEYRRMSASKTEEPAQNDKGNNNNKQKNK